MLNNDIATNISKMENIIRKRQSVGIEELTQEDVDVLFDNFRNAQTEICEFIRYSKPLNPSGHKITWGKDAKINCYTTSSLIDVPLSLSNRKILHHSYVLLTDIIFAWLRGTHSSVTKPTNCEKIDYTDASKPCVKYLTYTYVMSTVMKDTDIDVKYVDVHEEDIDNDCTTFQVILEQHNINILNTVWLEVVKNSKS